MAPRDMYFDGAQFNQNAPGSIGQQFNEFGATDAPDQALRLFMSATAQSLPALGLSRADMRRLQEALAEVDRITRGPAPDESRLRQCGAILRRVLEGAAGQALATVLLTVWHP